MNKYIKYVLPNNMKLGAGILLVENYRNNIPVIILFRDKGNKMYNDGGGGKETTESLRETAVRELNEESFNTFKLNRDSLNETNSVQVKSYTCYIIGLKNQIDISYYYYNKNIIEDLELPSYWKETDAITRISISQLLKDGILNNNNNNLETNDVNGNKIIINDRSKSCIKLAYLNGLISDALNNSVTIKEKRGFHSTKTYYS